MKKTALTVLGLAMAFGVANADNNYFGGNVSSAELSFDDFSDEATLTALYGRVGTHFNKNFSGEFRLGLGIADDTIGGADVELDTLFGAYVRGGFEASDSVYPYVVLGYSRLESTVSAPGFSSSDSETDVSYGIGVDLEMSRDLNFNVEYMNFLDKDGVEVVGFSVGLSANF